MAVCVVKVVPVVIGNIGLQPHNSFAKYNKLPNYEQKSILLSTEQIVNEHILAKSGVILSPYLDQIYMLYTICYDVTYQPA